MKRRKVVWCLNTLYLSKMRRGKTNKEKEVFFSGIGFSNGSDSSRSGSNPHRLLVLN